MSEEEKNFELKGETKKSSPPVIKIGDSESLGVDILDENNKFYIDKKFEKVERDLGEIKGLLNTKQEYDSSFHVDFKVEKDLLNKGFKVFCLISLIFNIISLVGVSCVILLSGFLWMGIQDDYVTYLALMCAGVVFGVTILTLFIYYVIRVCFIRRKISKYQIVYE